MATITKRGDYQYQAIIRRKGYPAQTKTFESRADAERWAREVEANIDTGYFRDRREVERTTLGQGLLKYLELITPKKRGHVAERNRILQLQAHPIALRPLASLRAKDFTEYRDERLKQVSPNPACGFVDSRLRRFPPLRCAQSCGRPVENALRFPPPAHRPAAAHKLHRPHPSALKYPIQNRSFRLIPSLELTAAAARSLSWRFSYDETPVRSEHPVKCRCLMG